MKAKSVVAVVISMLVLVTLACGGSSVAQSPSVPVPTEVSTKESVGSQPTRVANTPVPVQASPSFELFVVSHGMTTQPGSSNGWTSFMYMLGVTNRSTTQPRGGNFQAKVVTSSGDEYPATVVVNLNQAWGSMGMPVGLDLILVDQYAQWNSYVVFDAPSTLTPVAVEIPSESVKIDLTKSRDFSSLNQGLATIGSLPFTVTDEFVTLTVDSMVVSKGSLRVNYSLSNSDAAANHTSSMSFDYAVGDGLLLPNYVLNGGEWSTKVEVGPLQKLSFYMDFTMPETSFNNLYLVGHKDGEAPIAIKLK